MPIVQLNIPNLIGLYSCDILHLLAGLTTIASLNNAYTWFDIVPIQRGFKLLSLYLDLLQSRRSLIKSKCLH